MSTFRNNDTTTLPEEFEDFLTKFPKSILLAFGTTFQPTPIQSSVLFGTIKEMRDVGFVVGLRDDWELYQKLDEAKFPNVILKKFVPQTKLLNEDRIKGFITHGGAGSILEAIYLKTPMIVCPVEVD